MSGSKPVPAFATPSVALQPYPCYAAAEIDHPRGTVPHFLPGASGYTKEFATGQDLPEEAVRGGAETMYPEFMKKFEGRPAPRPTSRSTGL